MKNRTLNEIRQSKEYQQAVESQELKGENFYKNPFSHADVDKTIDQIVEDLQPVIYDTIFELINNEMGTRYVFDSSEYLTSAGLELFEDEWFEFYHTHHGDIMHKLMSKITN